MNLPSQDQVNAIARHVASFAGGAIVMFGLGTKVNPATVTAIVNATGTLVNDFVVLAGLVSPMVAAYFASRSASQTSQVKSVLAMQGVEHIEVNAKATPALAVIAVDPANAKIAPIPAAEAAAQKTAAAA